jgi:hypothetical protein
MMEPACPGHRRRDRVTPRDQGTGVSNGGITSTMINKQITVLKNAYGAWGWNQSRQPPHDELELVLAAAARTDDDEERLARARPEPEHLHLLAERRNFGYDLPRATPALRRRTASSCFTRRSPAEPLRPTTWATPARMRSATGWGSTTRSRAAAPAAIT